MPLLPAPLSSGLANLEPTDDVNSAIETIASAFVDYFSGASVLGIVAVPAILSGVPKTAMKGAMTGLNDTDGAAGAISDGIAAFWDALVGIEVTVWIMVPPTVITPGSLVAPPSMSGLESAIQGAFDGNVAGELELTEAANVLATAIHGTQLGGLIETVTPPSAPIESPVL